MLHAANIETGRQKLWSTEITETASHFSSESSYICSVASGVCLEAIYWATHLE